MNYSLYFVSDVFEEDFYFIVTFKFQNNFNYFLFFYISPNLGLVCMYILFIV